MTYAELVPLFKWMVGLAPLQEKVWTGSMLAYALSVEALRDHGLGVLALQGALPSSLKLPRELEPVLTQFRHRTSASRVAACTRFLGEHLAKTRPPGDWEAKYHAHLAKTEAPAALAPVVNWEAKYHELRAAVLDVERTRNPGSRADAPYTWALHEARRARYRLRILLGLVDPEKVPEKYR